MALSMPEQPAAGNSDTDANNWHLLVDQSGKLTLDEVLAQRALLQRLEQRHFNSPGGTRAIWLQIAIPPHAEPLWLWLAAPRVEFLDFHLIRDGRLEQRIETGERRPSSSRPLATLPYLFNLPADGQPREVLVRLQSSQPLTATFEVVDESGFLRLEGNAYLYGALLGALFALVLYNLKRLIITGYRGHAWLGSLNLALLLSCMANIGLLSGWLPRLIYSQSLFADVTALTACMLLLTFALRFFQSARRRWDGAALRTALWLLGVQLLAMLVAGQLRHSLLVYLSAALTMLLVAGVAGYHWQRGYRPARLVLVGSLLLLFAFAWLLLTLAGWQPIDIDGAAPSLLWIAPLAGLSLSLALLERQQRIAADRQRTMASEAVSSAESRGRADFLAHISHEIRAPLNGVLGMTELLFSTPLSAKQRDYVQTIRTSGNELLNLINELLDFPKLQSGAIELEEVQFNLPALVADCLDIFRARAEQQEVELISFIQPSVPQTACGDPARLRQILLNLLDNALKQTDSGEVLVDLRLVEGSATPRLRICVQDNGQPLQTAEQSALLRSVVESHDFLSASALGARISLLIARQLAELMQGSFGVDSNAELGNAIWIELPLREPGTPLGEADDLDGEDRALRGVRLLIVDDNETCRKVLVQQCGAWGMEVTAVASGKEALALLRTKAHLAEIYDVVLLDQEMPGMTGLQLAMRIKEDLNLKHDLLLIMLTGISHAPSKVVARNAGIKRILTKPVAGYTLKTTLAEELGRRPPSAETGPSVEPPPEVPADFRILVAEDDVTSTKVMRGMLNKLNLAPDMVTNGEEALRAIKAGHYDLVLMDCEMPLLDGYTATRLLREWETSQSRPRTPVVALTAHVFSEHRNRAREAGMDGHMCKPVELSELRELIQHWAAAKAPDVAG